MRKNTKVVVDVAMAAWRRTEGRKKDIRTCVSMDRAKNVFKILYKKLGTANNNKSSNKIQTKQKIK